MNNTLGFIFSLIVGSSLTCYPNLLAIQNREMPSRESFEVLFKDPVIIDPIEDTLDKLIELLGQYRVRINDIPDNKDYSQEKLEKTKFNALKNYIDEEVGRIKADNALIKRAMLFVFFGLDKENTIINALPSGSKELFQNLQNEILYSRAQEYSDLNATFKSNNRMFKKIQKVTSILEKDIPMFKKLSKYFKESNDRFEFFRRVFGNMYFFEKYAYQTDQKESKSGTTMKKTDDDKRVKHSKSGKTMGQIKASLNDRSPWVVELFNLNDTFNAELEKLIEESYLGLFFEPKDS